MGLHVEPPFLRGFAGQLDANRRGALLVLMQYCTDHCGDTTGLDNLLAITREVAENASSNVNQLLLGGCDGLESTAADLRAAADAYDAADAAAADRLWTAGEFRETSTRYRETDITVVSSGFSAGASIALAFPPQRDDTSQLQDSVHTMLGLANSIVTWVTGKDFLNEVVKIVFSDWGQLRRIGYAYNELERGLDEVANDVEFGTNVVSAHWTGDANSASAGFDHEMRDGWVRGFRTLADMVNGLQQTFEWIANAYELAVSSMLLGLNFYADRIVRYYRGLQAAFDAKAWAKFTACVTLYVSCIWGIINDTVRLIYQQTKMFCSEIEMIGSSVYMLEVARGDLAIFKQGM